MRDTMKAFFALIALACLAAAPLASQDGAGAAESTSTAATAASAEEEALFGAETVVQADTSSAAAPGAGFLKYAAPRIGGSVSGSLGYDASWNPAWDGGAELLKPEKFGLKPSLSAEIDLTAKPSADFGFNMDLKTAYPFARSAGDASGTAVPNIFVSALYSKFSWKDALFFSFGKQPISWGVSKSAFQPADDIFALGAVNIADTGAVREGPISLKLQYPVPRTMTSLYFFGGLPEGGDLEPADLRLATKGEFSLGNTEIGAGAYYAYSDHPRGLLMATTGNGDFNFFGEAVLKYGSERTFLVKRATPRLVGAIPTMYDPVGYDDRFFFTGTAGGIYTDSSSHLTVSLSYLYNGEGQPKASASDAYALFAAQIIADSAYSGTKYELDRMRFGLHYAFGSISFSELFGSDRLSASLYGIANLSDLSGMIVPSMSWKLFDYASLKIGGTFNFGKKGSEFILYGPGTGPDPAKEAPGAALNILLSLGSGSF
jgi:hypothetical protein